MFQDLQTNHDNTSLEWNSDVRTEAASNHWGKHTLRQVTMMSLKKHGLIEECNVPEETMLQFMDRVEKGYHPENPYHNTIHAADVTLTVSGICFRDSCSLALKPHQVLALIVAAAVHDVDHQGEPQAEMVQATLFVGCWRLYSRLMTVNMLENL